VCPFLDPAPWAAQCFVVGWIALFEGPHDMEIPLCLGVLYIYIYIKSLVVVYDDDDDDDDDEIS